MSRTKQVEAFAEAIHKKYPGKLLAYNCSPSFNWKKNLNDNQIATFQQDLACLGYKYQFITLAGIHSMFDLAKEYSEKGMTAYVEKVQEPEFKAREKGYTFVSHQKEVGTGYNKCDYRGFNFGKGNGTLDRKRTILIYTFIY